MDETTASVNQKAIEIIETETLRPHPQVVYFAEWIAAQMPWKRSLVRRVGERIKAA